jgi:outer membrane receptor protein involved in Fe transport
VIVNATITIRTDHGNQTIQTDGNGSFLLADAAGASVIEASAPGFATRAVAVDAGSGEMTITLPPAGIREQVVVTPARGEISLQETTASVSVIYHEQLESSGAVTIDQRLRTIPGFTLFRRSSSFTANPTAQGVSLRGVGASGASRALVVRDGVPLNDPFGGWVYWSRIPIVGVDSVEVVRGGSSHLYGSDALSGVINVVDSVPTASQLVLDASYGAYHTGDLSLLASGVARGWRGSFTGQVFDTDGYIQIRSEDKGRVDTPAGVRFGNAEVKLGRDFHGDGRLWFTGRFFNESRENGTTLQTNSTRLSDAAGAFSKALGQNLIRMSVYGGPQRFAQSFSAIAADRNSETLIRTQQVPAQQVGGSVQWSRKAFERHSFTAGVDMRDVRGASNELVFIASVPTTQVSAGGKQRSVGVFGQDAIQLHPRWLVTIGGRVDTWQNVDASSRSAPVANPTGLTITNFPDKRENAFSPHAAVLFKATDTFALIASAYGAFRAPTLNELYRSFRVGNILTLANDELQAERLYGGELGGRYLTSSSEFRANFFWSETKDPIANRTLSVTPALITRQRENLGQTRARGLELEARHRLTPDLLIGAGYQFVDSTVVSFPANRSLETLQLPQVPRHQLSFYANYIQRDGWTLSFNGRFSSEQFEDDQNLLPLDSFFTADAFVGRQLTSRLQLYVAAENVFDQRYEVGRTPVVTIGSPLLARAGVRLQLGRR